MTVLDLSHPMESSMPVYPGTEPPRFEPANTYEKDGFKETKVTFFTHTGTHMDPPAHILPGRTSLDQFPPSQFIGTAVVIDCGDIPAGGAIGPDRILSRGPDAEKADFLLFRTGWDRFWGTPEYFGDYPCLTMEAIGLIIKRGYKGIGLDVIGLDPVWGEALPRHKRLFQNTDIVNIENLTRLDMCPPTPFHFSCFPLPIHDADGSPVRAVAWWDE